MSQSPLDDKASDGTFEYQQGWRALNRLLHEGRSFSGHEKHCAFLNTGPNPDGSLKPFADVSHALGFDFAEDGRSIALVDWDFDGDLDLWMTNRTAPRLRLLRNNQTTKNSFLSIQLEGNGASTNRDAIGARLSLHLAGEPVPRLKTLHAGQSFLAQSSRWLNFGLGDNPEIEKLIVLWPAGGKQEFSNLKPNSFYKITQNRPAKPWTPPLTTSALKPGNPTPLPTSREIRTIVPPGMLLPPILLKDDHGKPQRFQRQESGLLLVNLWSSLCLPCQQELKDWSDDADEFRKANIEVLALLTDGPSDPGLENALRVINETKFPFPWKETSPLTVRSLDLFHSAMLDLWSPIPVPSSFLVDQKGEVIAVYTGPVHAKQIVADAALATASPEDRRNAAVPFPGLWVLPPTLGDSNRVANQMIDHDETDLAISYLRELTSAIRARPASDTQRRDLGDSVYLLGVLLGQSLHLTEAMEQLRIAKDLGPDDPRRVEDYERLSRLMRDHDSVISQLRQALETDPTNNDLRYELGMALLRQGELPPAIKVLEEVISRQPANARARFVLADALLQSNRAAESIEHYKLVLSHDPRFLNAANRLSWIFATHPDPSIRSTEEALGLAQRLCGMTKNQNPYYLDTLASAQAANGQFKPAVASAKAALAIYSQSPAYQAEAKALTERLHLFESNQPYLDSRWEQTP